MLTDHEVSGRSRLRSETCVTPSKPSLNVYFIHDCSPPTSSASNTSHRSTIDKSPPCKDGGKRTSLPLATFFSKSNRSVDRRQEEGHTQLG